jgi:ABC-type multidrug transport system fused ATPase/permease subunit
MSILICPNCKAELASTVTICEWCGQILNRVGDDAIESIQSKITELIIEGKNLPTSGILSSLWRNSKISMTVFAIASFIIAFKGNELFFIVGIIFIIIAFLSIFKKRSTLTADKTKLESEFTAEIQKIQSLYGSNNDVAKKIQEFKNEWKKIDNSYSTSKKFEWISYLLIIGALLFAYFMPSTQTAAEIEKSQIESEQEIVDKAQRAIDSDSLDKAISILQDIKSSANKIAVSSMLQLKQSTNKVMLAEQMIMRQQFDSARNELQKLMWDKKSLNYDGELIEEPYYIKFVKIKNSAIGKLPEAFSIAEEDELNF